MRARRVGSSTLSLFAGVSLISSGLISAFLAGAHGTQYAHTAAATNICGQHPLAAVIRPGMATVRQARLQLDSASVRQVISPSTPAIRPTAPPSNPGGPISSATPTTPVPTSSATSPVTPPPTTPAPTPTTPKPTPTTPKPTPTPTRTPTPPPPVQLCLSVQAAASSVQPGGTETYAIWVWPSGGTANGITVTVSAKISGALTPRFSVCRVASGVTCSVGSLANGQADELLATVTVPTTAKAGQRVALTATAKATAAKSPVPAAASALIAAKAGSTPTTTSPTLPGSTLPTGVGATLPGGILIPLGVAASSALPVLPTPNNAGGLFPTVGPGATPSASTGTLPNARGVRVTDASASFPLSTRLLGGQVLGLAVLAAALVIAVARLSLREPRGQHSKDHAP
jgi:hypothetical protein